MSEDRFNIDGEKLSLHPQRVAQWLDAGDSWELQKKIAPLYVEVSPVGACNHRCAMCSVDYIGYKNVRLSREVLERALADMGDMGVKSVMYAGEGEPLLHQEIPAIVRWTKFCGIDVAFTTNATGLNERVAECLGDVTWLKASINGGTPEVYAQVHQTKAADFPRVIANLARAVKLRDEMGWKTTLGAQIVLLPENCHTVDALAETCRGIGLDYLVVKPYSQNPHSTGTAERGYDKFDYQQYLANVVSGKWNMPSFQVIYRMRTMENLTHEREYKTCHSTPFMWSYLMASGDVYACSAHLLDDRFCLGNINTQSFSEIWEGEKRHKLVETMRDLDLSVCRKNCRMEAPNRFLWQLKHPEPHDNFV